MRKIFAFVVATALLCACSKQNEEIVPENVTFKLSYSMDKGASMTRVGEEAYNSFYENFVKTKVVGYPEYDLSFYKGDVLVGSFKGSWDATTVTLPEGEYIVKGTSGSYGDDYSDYEKSHKYMSLRFQQEISVKKSDTTLELNPEYDCYLLFFDGTVFNHVEICGDYRYSFRAAGNIKYAFINSKSIASRVDYTTKDGDSGKIEIDAFDFRIGNYYCMDAVATGYQVSPMNNGF